MTYTKKNKRERLIDGIDFHNNIFLKAKNSDAYDKFRNYLDKYYYQGVLVEDLKIIDFESEQYREDFYDFIDNDIRDHVDDGKPDDYHQQLFALLLMLRIDKKDSRAFFLLSDVLKKSMGFEYNFYYVKNALSDLFLSDIAFFITSAYACPDGTFLLDYINREIGLHDLFMTESKFIYDIGAKINFKQGQLFLDPLRQSPDVFSKELYDHPIKATFQYSSSPTRWKIDWEFRNRVWMNDPVDKYFGRNMEHRDWKEFRASKTERSEAYNLQWEGRVIDFYDVRTYIVDDVLRKFNGDKDYIEMYRNFIYSTYDDIDKSTGLDWYMIRNYYTNGSDGYVNLRNKPSVDSDIVISIPNGTYLTYKFGGDDKNSYVAYDHNAGQFVRKNNKWIYIYYRYLNDVGEYVNVSGFVHSSQLEQR